MLGKFSPSSFPYPEQALGFLKQNVFRASVGRPSRSRVERFCASWLRISKSRVQEFIKFFGRTCFRRSIALLALLIWQNSQIKEHRFKQCFIRWLRHLVSTKGKNLNKIFFTKFEYSPLRRIRSPISLLTIELVQVAMPLALPVSDRLRKTEAEKKSVPIRSWRSVFRPRQEDDGHHLNEKVRLYLKGVFSEQKPSSKAETKSQSADARPLHEKLWLGTGILPWDAVYARYVAYRPLSCISDQEVIQLGYRPKDIVNFRRYVDGHGELRRYHAQDAVLAIHFIHWMSGDLNTVPGMFILHTAIGGVLNKHLGYRRRESLKDSNRILNLHPDRIAGRGKVIPDTLYLEDSDFTY